MLQRDIVTTFEFEEGHVTKLEGIGPFRGIRHNYQRPFYVTIEATTSTMYSLVALQRIRKAFFLSIINVMAPGPLKGRIMIKPKWLYDAILQNKDI